LEGINALIRKLMYGNDYQGFAASAYLGLQMVNKEYAIEQSKYT